jgi:hypothetical protein
VEREALAGDADEEAPDYRKFSTIIKGDAPCSRPKLVGSLVLREYGDHSLWLVSDGIGKRS